MKRLGKQMKQIYKDKEGNDHYIQRKRKVNKSAGGFAAVVELTIMCDALQQAFEINEQDWLKAIEDGTYTLAVADGKEVSQKATKAKAPVEETPQEIVPTPEAKDESKETA